MSRALRKLARLTEFGLAVAGAFAVLLSGWQNGAVPSNRSQNAAGRPHGRRKMQRHDQGPGAT